VAESLREPRAELERLLDTWEEGHLLRDGALVAIAGRPNVGKSTLLNALLKKERAIVSQHAGTTRDTIEETWLVQGIPVRLVDTAGLRDSTCEIEQEGVERASSLVETADGICYVMDGSCPLEAEDSERLAALAGTGRILVVLNKLDLGQALRPGAQGIPGEAVECSLTEGRGVDGIVAGIARMVGAEPRGHGAVISERHRKNIQSALNRLNAFQEIMRRAAKEHVLAAIELRQAAEDIGAVTGRVYTADLLDYVFRDFCIGK
jgi:tRNA modification GTPase